VFDYAQKAVGFAPSTVYAEGESVAVADVNEPSLFDLSVEKETETALFV